MRRFKASAIVTLALSATAAAVATTWNATGSMTEARANATATVLTNGLVLVAGGKAGLGPLPVLATSELYDPATGGWSPTGSMSIPRQIATATLLADGRVLVAGGRSGSGSSTTAAEIYDPSTGAWSTTGSMRVSRVRHSAALLPDGRVLVAGGLDDTAGARGQSFLKSAEIYDPASQTWSMVEAMSINRYGFALVTLNDGRPIAIGGAASAGDAVFNKSAEIFDPATGRWSRTHDMSEGRGFFPATLLADGRVLAAGGSIHDGNVFGNIQTDGAEIYDPVSGRWTRTASLSTKRTSARAVTLDDGRVLVAGGNLYDLVGNGINLSIVDRDVLSSSEIWDPATEAWTSGGNMSESRTGFTLVKVFTGAVLAAGGNALVGAGRSSADLFQ